MTTVTEPEILTTEQLDAMPEDGMERWLIRGQLREGEMTNRNRGHSRIKSKDHSCAPGLARRPAGTARRDSRRRSGDSLAT